MPSSQNAPAQDYLERINGVRRSLNVSVGRRAPIDALLVTSSANVGYLSGFTGSLAHILITSDEAIFITDGRYTAQAARQCPNYTLVEAKGSGGYMEALALVFKERPAKNRVGFDDAHVTVGQLKSWRGHVGPLVRWLPAANIVESLRTVKDAAEVALIREAIKIAEAAFNSVRPTIKPGVSEREFALELDFTMRRMGADSPSFDTIVASGPNGAFPHHEPTDREFQAGDLVTVDWGARTNEYCSDLTRTVAVPGGKVDETLRTIYGIVLEAKIRATEACKVGANGQEVDAVARQVIADAGYGDAFKHGLGHGLGREVHDGMTLSQRASKIVLEDGTVTTVEPGIYIDGLGGIRIEEDVLVTQDGPIILSTPSEPLA